MDGRDSSQDSSAREKVIEYLFTGELLRCLWKEGVRDMEVLRAEVDMAGYDLVVEAKGLMRHIQLKSSYRGAKTAKVDVHTRLATKPSGCVVWVLFDPVSMDLGPFLWFGESPGLPLPPLGERLGKHSKGDRTGRKADRPNMRVVTRGRFHQVPDIKTLARKLFHSCVRRPEL